MNIEASNINSKNSMALNYIHSQKNSSVKFTDELKELDKTVKQELSENEENTAEEQNNVNEAVDDLNTVVKELNQSEEKTENQIKENENLADKDSVINKDLNIQENKEIMPQMNPNMNFGTNGQPFSSFMNNDNNNLSSSANDLAEEVAILSTMAENMALINKRSNSQAQNSDTAQKTVIRNDAIKTLDLQSGVTIERVVKFDSIIMNQADVEVFANLVETGSADINNLTSQATQKSVQVSKTLVDMLVKAQETNQPLRIDFDNNISIIIRISKDGKLSAEFLPSSQVAEAYLKENLPLLKQKFDESNIDYENLSQRNRRDNKDNNRKKGRNDE